MNRNKKLKLGELLLNEGIITSEQLDRALSVQKSQKAYKPLGEICVELQFLSSAQLNRILNKYQKRIRTGDLLVNLGLISQEQLQTALAKQKSTGRKLGKILIEMGFITENPLIHTLTIQLGVPKIIPDFHFIDNSLFEGISEEFLLKNEVLPALKEDGVLTVIMSDPLDDLSIRALGRVFQCKIDPAIAPSADIRNAIKKYYEKDESEEASIFVTDKKDLIIGDTNLSLESGDNIVSILDYIITNAITEGASDIHIEPKEKSISVRYRVDGILRHKTDLPGVVAPNLSSRIKVLCGLDIAEKRRHQDGRIEARIRGTEIDLRISVYASVYGENVVVRILHRQSELTDLDSLGLSPVNRARYQQILDQPSGIILATGPTGSGKTTTLYASLNHLNDGQKAIITVEDPVEYTIEGVVQGQINHQLGHTYVDFLKAMMRQDPDVIMVGEIRDSTAAEAVIQAGLTGHKVLSTFHTDDTTGALLRLMDMGIDTFLISSTVVSILSQRLVRMLCKHCREPCVPEQKLLASFNIRPLEPDQCTFYRPVGCAQCDDTGFKGRTAIHELLCLNDPIRDAILARKTSSEIRLIAREKANLISLHEDGFYKASRGLTSMEEVMRVVFYNESDKLSMRQAEEIIALCEDKSAVDMSQLAPVVTAKEVREEAKGPVSIIGAKALSRAREVPGIHFDLDTMDEKPEDGTDLFELYRQIMEKIGKAPLMFY